MTTFTDTNPFVSLFANSFAIAISSALGFVFAKYKKADTDYFDVMVAFVSIIISVFLVYFFVFKVFGYVPMGKISTGWLH